MTAIRQIIGGLIGGYFNFQMSVRGHPRASWCPQEFETFFDGSVSSLLKAFWGWNDQQLRDGTVIWTSPSGDTYVTTPGSALLFPSLCAPTGELTVPDVVVDDRCGEHTAMMRTRRRTRAQNRADRIAAERQQNQRARESTTTTAGGRVLRELPPRRRRRPAALLLESLLLTATKGIDISEAAVLTKLVLR